MSPYFIKERNIWVQRSLYYSKISLFFWFDIFPKKYIECELVTLNLLHLQIKTFSLQRPPSLPFPYFAVIMKYWFFGGLATLTSIHQVLTGRICTEGSVDFFIEKFLIAPEKFCNVAQFANCERSLQPTPFWLPM